MNEHAPQAETALKQCIGTVNSISNKHVVGFCFLIDPGRVITCFHVVAAALNINNEDPRVPQDAQVEICWPYLGNQILSMAQIEFWRPTPAEDEDWSQTKSDICILKLKPPVPHGIRLQRIVNTSDYTGDNFYAIGATSEEPGGSSVFGTLHSGPFDGTVFLNVSRECRLEINQGYSGSPVYSFTNKGIVGMVFRVKEGINEAKMIPVSEIKKVWDSLQCEYDPITEYFQKLQNGLKSAPETQFVFKQDFALSVDTGKGKTTVTSLTDHLIRNVVRRAFLVAPAGGGKTVALGRIINSLIDTQTLVPVYLNLKKNQKSDFEKIHEFGEDYTLSINYLLQKFSIAKDTSLDNLREMAGGKAFLLVIDAFNEVYLSNDREAILSCLDNYIFNNSKEAYILIASRTTPTKAEKWTSLKLCDVDDSICSSLLISKNVIFNDLSNVKKRTVRIPFFLQIALKDGVVTSRSKAMERFMAEEIGLDKLELNILCNTIFLMYQNWKSQSILKSALNARLIVNLSDYPEITEIKNFNEKANSIISKLEDKGVLYQDTDQADHLIFDHQLRTDYLSARYLAMAPELNSIHIWNEKNFDKVTFEGISDDVLIMAFEQLKDAGNSDTFLERVYDWSWEIALKCVKSRLIEEENCKLNPIDTAIIAIITQKRFDPIPHTKKTAETALNQLPDSIKTITENDSIEDIIKSLPEFPEAPEWYKRWLGFFKKYSLDTQEITEDDLRSIVAKNSIEGWSSANILKRFKKLDAPFQMVVRGYYYAEPYGASRWRIVHLLGSFPEAENIILLKKAILEDDYMWVMYGAGRSLIECAAKAKELKIKTDIAKWIRENAQNIKNPKVRYQIGRTLLIEHGQNWKKLMNPVIQCLINLAPEDEKEDWEKIRKDFKNEN